MSKIYNKLESERVIRVFEGVDEDGVVSITVYCDGKPSYMVELRLSSCGRILTRNCGFGKYDIWTDWEDR